MERIIFHQKMCQNQKIMYNSSVLHSSSRSSCSSSCSSSDDDSMYPIVSIMDGKINYNYDEKFTYISIFWITW